MESHRSSANVAVLFADICGSTALYETVGDARALQLVTACLEAMTASVIDYRGSLIKTVGDEIICRFASAEDAVLAASDIQAKLDRRSASSSLHSMAVRIGLAYGPLIEENSDIFGDTVNLCARVVAHANPWQILVTSQLVEGLPAYLRATCRSLHAVDLKGKSEQVRLFDVVWSNDANLTLLAGSAPTRSAQQPLLRIRFAARNVLLTPDKRALSIGRDTQNDVVVASHSASRHHARIFLRSGKFILADQSTNGTYLATEEGTMVLRHEEAILGGSGRIGLGSTPTGEGALEYNLEWQ